ncbi:acyltransferase [Soonwooa purpurea]
MRRHIINIIAKVALFLDKAKSSYIYNNYIKKYNIDDNFIFNGGGIMLYGNGEIILGKNSYIGRFSTLQSSDNAKIYIGKNCKIGPFFSVWTHSSNVDCDYNFDEKIIPKIGNIIIEDGVWIGANVVITPGVTIGENAIIGANSVVTKDIPRLGIAGGVPAKFIRYKNI